MPRRRAAASAHADGAHAGLYADTARRRGACASQKRGASALRALTYGYTPLKARAGAAGAGEVLVQAMKRFQEDALVMQPACAALGSLVMDPSNQARCGRADAMAVVVEVLKMHVEKEGSNSQAVCAEALVALWNLSCDKGNQFRAIEAPARPPARLPKRTKLSA